MPTNGILFKVHPALFRALRRRDAEANNTEAEYVSRVTDKTEELIRMILLDPKVDILCTKCGDGLSGERRGFEKKKECKTNTKDKCNYMFKVIKSCAILINDGQLFK